MFEREGVQSPLLNGDKKWTNRLNDYFTMTTCLAHYKFCDVIKADGCAGKEDIRPE